MKILILGYSYIVRKRVLDALRLIPDVDGIDIASESSYLELKNLEGIVYNDYDKALKDSKADLVYISTVNSNHGEWAEKAIISGFHVVVDKPDFYYI